jgi:hypothetical protein
MVKRLIEIQFLADRLILDFKVLRVEALETCNLVLPFLDSRGPQIVIP